MSNAVIYLTALLMAPINLFASDDNTDITSVLREIDNLSLTDSDDSSLPPLVEPSLADIMSGKYFFKEYKKILDLRISTEEKDAKIKKLCSLVQENSVEIFKQRKQQSLLEKVNCCKRKAESDSE